MHLSIYGLESGPPYHFSSHGTLLVMFRYRLERYVRQKSEANIGTSVYSKPAIYKYYWRTICNLKID